MLYVPNVSAITIHDYDVILAPSVLERGPKSLKLQHSDNFSNLNPAPETKELQLRTNNTSATSTTGRRCNLFDGMWVPNSQGPLYTNCPLLSQAQNCQANGRPDKGYENWSWQPKNCNLPRFDARAFFRIMKGKTLGFVGDSVARNQMESLMCMLWQVEVPVSRGSKKMHKWVFRSHSVTIIRIWSAWLVHSSNEASDLAPADFTKVHLEVPDEMYMEVLSKLDVLVISSGHWFGKKSVYVSGSNVSGTPIGKQKQLLAKLKNWDALAISMRTVLKAVTSNPDYNGLTILRTYSPDHYEGGNWNTGGSCTGKTQPVRSSIGSGTRPMYRVQLEAFAEAERNITNKSKLRLMDITPVFQHRADGHPGPYRNMEQPVKVIERSRRGQPPPQDCLHWCMPGPIDTWNEFLLEMLTQT